MPSHVRRRRGAPRYLPAILCAALCVVLFLAVYLLAGGREDAGSASVPTPTAEPAAVTVEPTAGPTAEPSPEPTPEALPETADAGQQYVDRLTFLGDSLTYHMALFGYVPFTQVWVPEIATLALFSCPTALINYYPKADPENPRELSIADTAAAAQPEYLVISLGVNGMAVLDEDEFKRYYSDLIDSILENSPDTKIICQSIYPVVDGVAPKGITNENVVKANRWIQDVAKQAGLPYLNTYEILVDDAGGLAAQYAREDGYHVTEGTYELILQYIRTHAYE